MENVTDYEQIIMTLIVNCGEARSKSIEAMAEARDGNFEIAESLLISADESLGEAHRVQTNLIVQEAKGTPVKLSLLMIHAQDHLMNAITVREMANEIISLNKAINSFRI